MTAMLFVLLSACVPPICGNGITEQGEGCDDGNLQSADGCNELCLPEESKAFLIDSVLLPKNAEEALSLARDLNQDGQLDERDNVADKLQSLSFLGLDPQRGLDGAIDKAEVMLSFELTAADFVNDDNLRVLAYQGELVSSEVPAFDGSDVILAEEVFDFGVTELKDGVFTTGQFAYLFPLVLDEGLELLLPFEESMLSALVDESTGFIKDGVFSGLLRSIEQARALPLIADFINDGIIQAATEFNGGISPLFCSSSGQCPGGSLCTDRNRDGLVTGVCVDLEDFVFLALVDSDRDGIVEVLFDEATKSFPINELSLLFDFVQGVPVGLIGNLNLIDFNDDGLRDAMGLAVSFSAAPARLFFP